MNIDDFFHGVVCDMLPSLEFEENKRTGVNVAAMPGVTFKTDLETEGFPLLSLRRIGMSFVPEQMWFVSGQKDTAWLTRHTKIWDSFTDEDGTVSAAYGWRWRHQFGVDQLEKAVEKLTLDKSTRHAVVVAWDPAVDVTVRQKNVPCPVMFTLNVIGGRLHMHNVIRSNDMVLGFPTDVAGFAFLQLMLAQRLGIKAGIYTHSISNAHIYENQLDAVKEMQWRRSVSKAELAMPDNAYARAKMLDDSLIADVKAALTGYEPHPPIKNIPIAI